MRSLVLVTLHYIWLFLPDIKTWQTFYYRMVQISAFETKMENLLSSLHANEAVCIGSRRGFRGRFSKNCQKVHLYIGPSGPKTILWSVSYWKQDMTLRKKIKRK
jgi:hypothetical protein